jgi:hypothetical protein
VLPFCPRFCALFIYFLFLCEKKKRRRQNAIDRAHSSVAFFVIFLIYFFVVLVFGSLSRGDMRHINLKRERENKTENVSFVSAASVVRYTYNLEEQSGMRRAGATNFNGDSIVFQETKKLCAII